MGSKILHVAAAALAVLFFFDVNVGAQSAEGVRETWSGPDASLFKGVLKKRENAAGAAAKPRLEVLKFTPAGDSGVAKALAEAFGRTADEKAAMAEVFGQLKQGYEAEVAKEGKSNNLAAAMAFFISANVAAFHQTDLPPDEAGENLFQSLQQSMAGVPAFARLSNAEKQQIHDWLVCMGGFVLKGYVDAKQSGDKQNLKEIGELSGQLIRQVLGVELADLRFKGNELSSGSDGGAPSGAGAAENRLVGTWSISASSPAGGSMATDAGYYKGQYRFAPDGSYSFKAERWFGYSRAREFYTTEESGTYSVNGESLTVSPKTSRTILRNPEGVVQKTQNNQLERVTYKWRLHYFEGLNETQLVLQPPAATTRDGGFSSNSLFPNSYLYSPDGNLEWRF